ncbi:MAG: hypothetical protein HQ592_02165, partial [Planctomycetes bacterium]|nr:hypothetical protein [Planctomycetota bacterium]
SIEEEEVSLLHDEYAYRRGGLVGRYYRDANFTDLICERIDPFVYFFDDREQFTPPVTGAHSAIWEGAIYVSETETVDLELAIWNRDPAQGCAFIDGELILELLPEEMAEEGFKGQKVLLTEGLHVLRLEYVEPKAKWTFALFQWRTGQGYKERIRETFGNTSNLYHLENLGTTYYHWNDAPDQVYTQPFAVPPGKNVLHFHTVDQAGHIEAEQRREFK